MFSCFLSLSQLAETGGTGRDEQIQCRVEVGQMVEKMKENQAESCKKKAYVDVEHQQTSLTHPGGSEPL